MNREQVLKAARSDDERQLLARIADLAEGAEKRGAVGFSHFLTPAEQALIERAGAITKAADIFFDGGYEGAERKMAVIYRKGERAEYTLPAVAVELETKNPLGHRDILGALLALGIKRETVGDILDRNNPPAVIVSAGIADFILANFARAGRGEVSLRVRELSQLVPAPQQTSEVKATVMSLRLDAVVAEGFSLSRGRAAEAIKGGKVALNWVEVDSPAKEVKEGDKISLKGLGKIHLETVGGESKKGRTFIRYIVK